MTRTLPGVHDAFQSQPCDGGHLTIGKPIEIVSPTEFVSIATLRRWPPNQVSAGRICAYAVTRFNRNPATVAT